MQGHFNRSIGVCQGDNGGGLVFQNYRDNRYYVHGIRLFTDTNQWFNEEPEQFNKNNNCKKCPVTSNNYVLDQKMANKRFRCQQQTFRLFATHEKMKD
ncbi:hypothetical protein NQ317_009830 [Molorchus minor]|uniref:Uncharacterized protein n=1 Tax=Molorchus minor TaxID=1323400 RepID=A0ABQ9JTW3_9CUCU|nr:hypothetical protein NQ317_009830 [Molorchus minor]